MIRVTNRCHFLFNISLFIRLFPTCFGPLPAHHQGYPQLLLICCHLVHVVLSRLSACVWVCGLFRCGAYREVPLFLTVLNNTSNFSTRFFKSMNIKFHENPFRRSRVVPCGGKDWQTDRQTDITKIIINFRNYANAPRNNGQKYNCADLNPLAYTDVPETAGLARSINP